MGWFTTSSAPEPKDAEPIKHTHTLESEALALNSDEEQHLSQPSDLSSTKTGDDEKAAEIQAAQAAYIDYSHTQRLNLPPYPRISLTFATAGGYGFMSGFYGGFKLGSLKYLALNAHRLPKTKGGWYFYHKRKNYVVLKQGLQQGFKTAAKYGFVSAGYMGLEAYIDHARGTIDAFSTIGSALIFGSAYAAYNRMSRVQTLTSIRSFFLFGLVTGLAQDGLRYVRGNDVWYLPKHDTDTDESNSAESIEPLAA